MLRKINKKAQGGLTTDTTVGGLIPIIFVIMIIIAIVAAAYYFKNKSGVAPVDLALLVSNCKSGAANLNSVSFCGYGSSTWNVEGQNRYLNCPAIWDYAAKYTNDSSTIGFTKTDFACPDKFEQTFCYQKSLDAKYKDSIYVGAKTCKEWLTGLKCTDTLISGKECSLTGSDLRCPTGQEISNIVFTDIDTTSEVCCKADCILVGPPAPTP